MGIKQLNKLCMQYCRKKTKSIYKIHLSDLYGKKICIDAMIYLYKFVTTEQLLENMFKLCTLFKKYNITPIFIFDGKAPIEKRKELDNRRRKKKEAKLEYDHLIKSKPICEMNKQEIEKLSYLKRNFVNISWENIEDIKMLLTFYGMNYLIADGEADKLCAKLVNTKKVYACMSDDMDLLAYGTYRVLREFDINKQTLNIYNLNNILYQLNMNIYNFKWLCILAGTDYNENENNIFYYYKLYLRNKLYINDINVYLWLLHNNIIKNDKLYNIYNMFDLNNYTIPFKNIPLKYNKIDKIKLFNLLEKEYFLNPLSVK
tara:strand:+ start:13094 stop:14041 length:948 start_codon:yes stop_codon:yes gene_type:complete